MKWSNAYIEMKNNKAVVRRKTWGSKYMIWLKPRTLINPEMCHDEVLKSIILKFGKRSDKGSVIEAKEVICLYTGYNIETGFYLKPEDLVADDWEIVNL